MTQRIPALTAPSFLAVLLLAPSAALAQSAATAQAAASVTISDTAAIEPTAGLDFGKVMVTTPASAASLTLGPAGDVSGTSNAAELGALPNPASFTVYGAYGRAFSLSLPQAAIPLGTAPGAPTVDSFTSSLAGNTGQLPSSGSAQEAVTVGGTLHIPAQTPPGSYSGKFQVSVAYN